MTLHPPLWAGAATYPAAADRRLVTRLWRSAGVLDHAGGHLQVTQRAAGANMSVDVAAGTAIIDGTDVANQGRFFCDSDAVVNKVVTAAPGAGTSRIDRIYAHIHDADVLGGASSWEVGYIAGTPAASPVAPTLPASSIPLAQFTVLSSTTSITTGMIADQRAEAPPLQRGLIVAEYGTPSQSVANSATVDKTLSTPTVRPSGAATPGQFWSSGTASRMLCPFTGIYDVFWTPRISTAGGYGWAVALRKNANSVDVAHTGQETTARNCSLSALGIYMTAGEYFRFVAYNITGASRSFTSSPGDGEPRLIYRGAG